MHRCFLLSVFLSFSLAIKAQNTAIIIGGDIDKFYPVVFKDNNWHQNKSTTLEIGRSDVHTDGPLWKGALIAKFTFHVSLGGHQANFIDADIKFSQQPFIAGWKDGSLYNDDRNFIIWLRGGQTTYYLNSDTVINYEIHDGVQAVLPYQEISGPLHDYKTNIDHYVNGSGKSISHAVYLNSTDTNFINGNLGIGTKAMASEERLSVNGKIRAKEIKVETANWPDYVFEDNYQLPDLKETEDFIKSNKHLPGIPSAKEVEEHGVSLGEMNAKLLKKVEELLLYQIKSEEKYKTLEKKVLQQQELINDLIKGNEK